MNRIADLLGAWGSRAWKTSKIPGMLRASVGQGLEFGAVRGEAAWQSRTGKWWAGCPRPYRPFREQRTNRSTFKKGGDKTILQL